MTNYLIRRMNRELAKNKFRVFGSSALILIAVASYLSMAGMAPAALAALEDRAAELNLNDYLVHVGTGNESLETQLEELPSVSMVDYRVTISSRIEYSDSADSQDTVSALLIGVEPSRLPKVNTLDIKSGSYFVGEGTGTVILENGFAERQGVSPGDTISVLIGAAYLEMQVQGLATSPEFMLLPLNPQSILPLPGTLAVVYMPIDSLRSLFGMDDLYVNELLTVFDQSADKDATIASVNSVLSSSGIIFAVQKDQMYGYYIVKEDLAQAEDFAGVMAFMILFAAFFVIYSHFSRTVEEQKKQIGVMRALGYSRGAVMGSYIYMALVIGLVGAISGVIAGYPIGAAFGDFYVSVVIGGGQSNFEVSAEMAITGFLFGPVTAILACAVAVWGTVSMDPYDAMRDMRTQKQRKRRARTSPRPHITQVSYITLYTLRNMFRRKRRTLFTIVAVAFAIVIGGMAFPMIGSFTNSMDSAITEREHWDIIVDYSYPLDYGTAEGIAGADVVDAVQVAKASGVWHFGEHAGSELVMSLEEGQTLHDYSLIDGTVFDGVDQIMVGYAFNKEYAAQVGDVITLEVVGGTRELTVSAVLGDLTGGFFVHEQVMDELLDGIVYSGSYVKCAPGKVESVSSALLENPLVANVELRSELQSGIIDLMESYNSLLYSFSLVGVGIATVTIANMVFMGILERYKEYGQLRAIGYSKRDTSKSIVTEISLTILISAVVSIPLLFILLESFVETFKNFWPVYRTMVHPEDMLGYGFVILLTLGFGLLAAVPAIRYLNRMDLAKTVAGSRFG